MQLTSLPSPSSSYCSRSVVSGLFRSSPRFLFFKKMISICINPVFLACSYAQAGRTLKKPHLYNAKNRMGWDMKTSNIHAGKERENLKKKVHQRRYCMSTHLSISPRKVEQSIKAEVPISQTQRRTRNPSLFFPHPYLPHIALAVFDCLSLYCIASLPLVQLGVVPPFSKVANVRTHWGYNIHILSCVLESAWSVNRNG